MAASLGKMPTTSGRRLISAFDALEWIDRSDLRPVRFWEGQSQHVVTRIFHHRSKLRSLRSQLIDHDVPLLDGSLRIVLRETVSVKATTIWRCPFPANGCTVAS